MSMHSPFPVYRYYRKHLYTKELELYDALSAAIAEKRRIVSFFPGTDAEKVLYAWQSDHPFCYALTMNCLISHGTLELSYYNTCGKDEDVAINRRIYEFASLLQPGMSDYRKIRLAHDFIAKSVIYDKQTELNSIRGVFVEQRSACLGISLAFKYLSDLCGVRSLLVWSHGTGNQSGHAWNYVQMNGNWYAVDVTNDRYHAEHGIIPLYDYFLVSSSDLNDPVHALAHPEILPRTMDFELYRKAGAFAENKKDIADIARKQLQNGGHISFKTKMNLDISITEAMDMMPEGHYSMKAWKNAEMNCSHFIVDS